MVPVGYGRSLTQSKFEKFVTKTCVCSSERIQLGSAVPLNTCRVITTEEDVDMGAHKASVVIAKRQANLPHTHKRR